MNTLGERLTHARKKNGFTQESLAESIGVSRGVIFNLEKNKTEPQTIVINAICQILKINKQWLENGTGEMEDTSEASQSAKILAELYEVAKGLSEEEQLFLLDTVQALKQRLGRGTKSNREEEYVEVYRAARSIDGQEGGITKVSKEELKRIREAPETTMDL